MSGNYGGSSIPTTPIGGDVLYSEKNGTYKHWVCTTVVGTAATANFTYEGNVYHVNTSAAGNSSIDMLITPSKLSAAPTGVWFACYECSCDGAMTGNTDSNVSSAYNNSFYSGRTPIQQVTFLGMGGNQN